MTEGDVWQVSGITRDRAYIVSSDSDGRPAYGGTPSDASVIKAIQDLKARGKKILLYPFIMMDIPAENGLIDPYGGSEQAAYPWRGRITCSPAPGRDNSPYGSAQITTDIAKLFGTAAASDFSISGEDVTYMGATVNAHTIRRMILHYTQLAKVAGGVDAFLIGTEMVQLTRLKNETNAFPAVDQYCTFCLLYTSPSPRDA